MAIFGPPGLFGTIGLAALLAALFGMWRLYAAPPVPSEDQTAYLGMARTTALAMTSEEEASEAS